MTSMSIFFRPAAGGPLAILLLVLFITGCASTSGTPDRDTADADTSATDTTAVADDVVPREIPRTVPRQTSPPQRESALDTVRAGRFDQGKMWTFEHPPTEYFAETYDFDPDDAWFEHVRLGALRIPGCSASFVSPNGLVLTNHHCGRGHATSVSREDENILDDGFYAESLEEERQVEGLWADQLIEIRDVTTDIDAAMAQAQTPAERAQARDEAIAGIEEEISNEMGPDYLVQVISLYNGGVYSAYIFRHYTDLRLVMIPELEIGFFGGDPDNFTYPRHTLDFSLFRVYDAGGDPLDSETYFEWTDDGVEPGDAVFAVGNPGSTFRLSSVAQVAFRRDVEEGAILDLISSRLEVLEAYEASSDADTLDDLRNQIFSLQNAQKLYRGTVRALEDEVIFARRIDAERKFREAVEADPQLRSRYAGLLEEMEEVQQQKREFAAEMRSFFALQPQSSLGSATMRRALVAYQYLRAQEQGAGEQALLRTLEQLEAVQDQPREIDENFLRLRFESFEQYFGEDHAIVRDVLGGRSPQSAAQQIINQSQLTTAESTREALTSGTLSMSDPAIQAAAAVMPRLAEFSSALAGLSAREEELGSRLGRARFEVYGTDVPPDATFSLRIADGVVQGYPYNGTIAPPYTTFYGLYDHYHSYGAGTAWDLPENWLPPPADLDLKTPLNFVSTNDIIGGNSGSPVVNTELELVGLVFDGNIESLSGDFIYLTDVARAVNVDARGIMEALASVYDAERIVLELSSGRLVPSDADAQTSN